MTRSEGENAANETARVKHIDGREGVAVGYFLGEARLVVRWSDGTKTPARCADLERVDA